MNCPSCGKEMSRGFLYCGGRPIFWEPAEPGYVDGEWRLDRNSGFRLNGLTVSFTGAAQKSPAAYRCPDCRKIIVEYENSLT